MDLAKISNKIPQALPNGWKKINLGQVASYINGKAFKPTEWSREGLPIIRIQNLNREKSEFNYCNFKVDEKYFVDCGDLLFAWSGTPDTSFGAHIWKGPKAVLNQHIFRIVVDEKIISKSYYLHALNHKVKEFVSKAHGTAGLAHITKRKFEESEIYLPPIPIQHAIVSKIEELLSELDKGKQQLETAQQQLKIYRQAVLKWAFEGRLTNENVKEGELPKGWILKPLYELGAWRGGGTPSKSRKDFWAKGNIMWVSPKDMKSQVIQDTIDKITADAIENSSTKLIPKGSILFVVRSGILRRTLPIALTTCEVTVNQDLQAFTPTNLLPEYVYWYVAAKNDDIRKTCSKDGTTVESIESTALKNYLIPVCSLPDQRFIIQEIESRLSVCDKVEETIATSLAQAETLRQSILKKAFEGKLV